MLCHVSADFPLNRRMRKAIARGKLHIVRVGGSGDGGGSSEEKKADDECKYAFFCQWVWQYGEIIQHSDEEMSEWTKDMVNAIGMEKIEKIISAARDHFLRRFDRDSKLVIEELKNAGVTIADYPRHYPKLAQDQKPLTESVDKKLLWGEPGPAGRSPYACVREHIQNVEKIFHLRGGEPIRQGRGFADYQYYQSHEAECVRDTCKKMFEWHEKQKAESNRRNAEKERQRNVVWFEQSRKAFSGLECSEVLAARRCIRSAVNFKNMHPNDDVKIIRALLMDDAFWREIKEEKSAIMESAARSSALALDRIIIDLADNVPSWESILASIKKAIKMAVKGVGRESMLDSVGWLIDYAMDTTLEQSKEGAFKVADGLEGRWYKLSESRYFAPDAWIQNLRELESYPIWIRGDSPELSAHKHVLCRLEEVHRSYFFGNWLAVVALSRSLLETALIDKFGQAIVYKEDGVRRSLTNMVDFAATRIPGIEIDMTQIVKDGNEVIHPRLSNPTPLERRKGNAQQCLRGIIRIISTLYPREEM